MKLSCSFLRITAALTQLERSRSAPGGNVPIDFKGRVPLRRRRRTADVLHTHLVEKQTVGRNQDENAPQSCIIHRHTRKSQKIKRVNADCWKQTTLKGIRLCSLFFFFLKIFVSLRGLVVKKLCWQPWRACSLPCFDLHPKKTLFERDGSLVQVLMDHSWKVPAANNYNLTSANHRWLASNWLAWHHAMD